MRSSGDKVAKPDEPAIRAALQVLFQPGDVVELRAFKHSRNTISGYYNDSNQLAADAVRANAVAGGVYVTLNQIDPALLARRSNRWEQYARETTTDLQVVRRRWLPIDIDAVRPAGISSTDSEHDAAIELARDIRAFLVEELGFPTPILGDSGNGAHVLARINLPNNDGATETVQKCLQALDEKFSNDKVHVDTGVYNAARIWKLYGTVVRKGDSTSDRPHRLARLL